MNQFYFHSFTFYEADIKDESYYSNNQSYIIRQYKKNDKWIQANLSILFLFFCFV